MSGTLGNIDMLPSSNTMHLRIIDMHKFTVLWAIYSRRQKSLNKKRLNK